MNHFTIPIISSILLLTLSACNNETDITQQPNDSAEQSGYISEPSSPQIQLPSTSSNDENGESLDQNEPLVLDDFRTAIDSIVQDSIQVEVEKAVEDEMSKKTNNQK